MTGEALLAGVDVGTASVRAIVFALDGRAVASGSRPTPIVSLGPGAAEFQVDALWTAVASAITEAMAGVDDPLRVRAIGAASFGESGSALDAAGRPVAPSHAWYDSRPAAQTRRLLETYGEVELGLRSGMRLDPVPGLAKLLWLRDEVPDAFARTTHWLNQADYVAWRLSGEMATDPSLAGRTLAFDLARECWNQALLADLGLPLSLLAPVAANGEVLGRVSAEAAEQTGLSRECLVTVGGHDHVLGAMAAGAMTGGATVSDAALDSIGTAEAYLRGVQRPVTDRRVVDWGFEQGLLRVGRPMRFLVGGLVTASACVEWFRRDVAGGASHDELVRAAERVPAGSHGVLFVPHLRLGSPPAVDAGARGAFLGLATETGRGVLFRALLEGLAFDLRKIADHGAQLAATVGTPAPARVCAIGGGTRNSLLVAIKAAAYGRPLEVLDMPESTCLGAALLAGIGAGLYADVDAAVSAARPTASVVTPSPELVALYESLYQRRYLPAVDALRALRAGADALPGVT